MTDEVTYMTDAHQAVIRHLENCGIGLMEEVDFPPFRADCYLPDYHAIVEVDGPRHEKKADKKRDRELSKLYGLYVFHILSADADRPAVWLDDLKVFLRYVKTTKDERWEKYGARIPWL